ncbi:cyclohexyl-isocyanide hydratase [Plantibacter sp. VKM Ac-1784]|uniref:Cyclohexyl-isocyanide hydratase n=1 Tax=Plantibacter elymi (nom. nud.) TaxID=199708 RepID=A0ABY1RDU6_9MICO|nr:DJ-1/PfpI family protein [Plantibacter sp. VKM Ac-1784]SMQ71159.1 cyclohexyl-isocyanide hydratase [Plantibacter sp. VKM Ac-1784]
MTSPLQIGLIVFPDMTQLDATGPLQVFTSIQIFAPDPGAQVHLLWKDLEPVPTDAIMTLTPTMTFADCPQLDVLCVPGGQGTDALLNDPEVIDFVRRQGQGAQWVTSVCTGALVLGAAGLLDGYHAATHWSSMHLLEELGAIPTQQRVVVDRNRVTGGGVTAGIDFALTLVAKLVDQPTAEVIQLRMEYNPAPPFHAGHPDEAPAEIVNRYKDRVAPSLAKREQAVAEAAARFEV